MKEFENDNWELKARQLADAFQPTPDESVWLNVEAALKKKKDRRGIFFWLFSAIGIAVLVYGGATIFLLNSGDRYAELNTQFEKINVKTVDDKNSSNATADAKNESKNSSMFSADAKTKSENKFSGSFVKKPDIKNQTEISFPKKNGAVKIIDTVVKQNAMDEKPDLIVTEINALNSIVPLNPFAFCGLNFQEMKFTIPADLIPGTNYRKKNSRWMLMASSSFMNQTSLLNSHSDSVVNIDKGMTNYFDAGLDLIYQFSKTKKYELTFGVGYYELTQKFNSVTEFQLNNLPGVVLFDNLPDNYSGSEFYSSAFSTIQIGLLCFRTRKWEGHVATGIRAEYLLKYTTIANSGIPPLSASNYALNNVGAFESAISPNTLKRIYVKALLNTSVRYTLSKHFAFQSGINSSYSITDRYKKSSSLHQHDLNYGLNAGVLFRF